MPRYVKVFRWLAAITTLTVLFLLTAGCIKIYNEGNSPENINENGIYIENVFSREAAAQVLKPVFILGGADVLLIAVTCLMQSGKVSERISGMTAENRLRLMKARVRRLPEDALKEERFRRKAVWIAGIIAGAFGCLALGYLLNGSNFVSWDLENVMSAVMLHVFLWIAAGLCVIYVYLFLRDRSMEREIEILGKCEKSAPEKVSEEGRKNTGYIRIALYIAAVLLIVLGIFNGGIRDVWVKAINICTECIGLG